MRTIDRPDTPAHRSKVRWAVDVVIAVFGGLSAVPYFLRTGHDGSSVLPFLVIALVVAPLLARRTHPLRVFAWVLLSAGVAGLWNHGVIVGLGVLIALYTVASIRPRVEAVLCAASVEAVVLAATIAVIGADWWYDAIPLTGLVLAATGLGLYTATRRAYLRELHDRADRLERDRDQQVALAAAAERTRIAREMHDVVAHHLTVMVALSDGAIAATTHSVQDGIEAMREVSATGRRALADTRTLLGVLREGATDGAARPTAVRAPLPDLSGLDDLIGRVRAAGLPTTLEIHGAATSIPANLQLTVYRVVQEALTNTLKHAGPASRASVRLHRDHRTLRIQIDDDGAGRNATVPASGGGGLVGMRERIQVHHGELVTGPRESVGWRVSAALPLGDADQPLAAGSSGVGSSSVGSSTVGSSTVGPGIADETARGAA